MSPVEWVDELPPRPPRSGKGPAYGWEAEDEVRAKPGRWAKVWTYPALRPSGKRSSTHSVAALAARKRGFDTATRPTEDGKGQVLYLRWPAENAPRAQEDKPAKPGETVDWGARAKPGGRRSVGYPCDHCGEELDTPAALKVHVKRQHGEQVA